MGLPEMRVGLLTPKLHHLACKRERKKPRKAPSNWMIAIIVIHSACETSQTAQKTFPFIGFLLLKAVSLINFLHYIHHRDKDTPSGVHTVSCQE
jgi:hypothetical protein